MKITELIEALEHIRKTQGELEVYLQEKDTTAYEAFYVLPEEYRPEDGGWVVNIRSWPY